MKEKSFNKSVNHNFFRHAIVNSLIAFVFQSVSFYFDVLATYDLTIYSSFIMPNEPEYASLLLSLNKILKCWRVPHYFVMLENNLNRNLFIIRAIKYFFYYAIAITWCSVVLFLEACPGEICILKR